MPIDMRDIPTLTHLDIRSAIHSAPRARTAKRLGTLIPISVHIAEDGTRSVNVMIPTYGTPKLTYTRRNDNTVHITKNGAAHHGPVTGTDQHPVAELVQWTKEVLTQEMATGTSSIIMAKAMVTPELCSTLETQLHDAALTLVNDALQKREAPSDKKNPEHNAQKAVNRCYDAHGLRETLKRMTLRYIIDPEVTALLPANKKGIPLDDERHNLMVFQKNNVLALQASHPETLRFHLTHTWGKGKNQELSETKEQLLTAIADALKCTGNAKTILEQGFADNRWAKLSAADVSKICRVAALVGSSTPRPATLNAIRELRDRIPEPNLLELHRRELYPYTKLSAQVERLQYLINALHLYNIEHDPAQYEEDLAWLKQRAAQNGRNRYPPTDLDPTTATWAELRLT